MHDGRFLALDAVFDHYNSQVQHTQNLDPSLEQGIKLSASERELITGFLNTLNDRSFLLDKRFSEP
jgi:cytochrome c peroxidase